MAKETEVNVNLIGCNFKGAVSKGLLKRSPKLGIKVRIDGKWDIEVFTSQELPSPSRRISVRGVDGMRVARNFALKHRVPRENVVVTYETEQVDDPGTDEAEEAVQEGAESGAAGEDEHREEVLEVDDQDPPG